MPHANNTKGWQVIWHCLIVTVLLLPTPERYHNLSNTPCPSPAKRLPPTLVLLAVWKLVVHQVLGLA